MPAKERPGWLPEGWTATKKKRRGQAVKSDWTYIDSSTGSRLYSKIAVFRYLESEGLRTPSPNKEGRIIVYSGADTSSSQRQSIDNKFNNNTGYSSSRLPDGWIKEYNLRKAGSKVKKEPIVKQPDGQVTRKRSSSGAIKRKPTARVGGPRDSPKWLPSGWITEIRTQQSGRSAGHKYKCFFDPVTETKFHSKRKLLEYLKSEEIHNPLTNKETSMETKSAGDICSPLTNKETSMETKSAGDICTSSNQRGSANNKFTSNTSSSSYELPDGWIKEVRLRNYGVKKDLYYIDPVSGYEFHSQKDAWQYIESGDVRMCTKRPRRRRKSDVYSIEKEDPAHPKAKPFKRCEKASNGKGAAGVYSVHASSTPEITNSDKDDLPETPIPPPPRIVNDDQSTQDNRSAARRQQSEIMVDSAVVRSPDIPNQQPVSKVAKKTETPSASPSTSTPGSDSPFSMTNCISELKKMNELPKSIQIKAISALTVEVWREAFMNMDAEVREAWLESLEPGFKIFKRGEMIPSSGECGNVKIVQPGKEELPRKTGQGHKKSGNEVQHRGSTAQLSPNRTKPLKTTPLPTRSSDRLARIKVVRSQDK